MPNAIPLLEGTDASGGFLVRDTYGQTLLDKINRESSVLSLSRVDQVPGKRQKYSVYAGRPTAAFVSEGAAKGTTGAEFSELTVNVKKIATNVLYTEELLEDAAEDPRVLINADVEAAFADLVDAHAIGKAAGTNLTTSFDNSLRQTTSTVELGTGGDAIGKAISDAMSTVESNGGTPSGIILATDGKAQLRNARGPGDNAATPVYTDGFNREPDSLYGLPLSYSTNLSTFATAAAATKIVGIVGDFSHSVAVMRSDLTVRASDQATVDVGGTLHHLWQQNKVALQWEMRIGYAIHDRNRMFVAIVDAS
jgi:HK97 family phage major capsid protein